MDFVMSEIPRKFSESFRPIPSSDENCYYHFLFRFRKNISIFVFISFDRLIPFSKTSPESPHTSMPRKEQEFDVSNFMN